jgi:hypothetical protein
LGYTLPEMLKLTASYRHRNKSGGGQTSRALFGVKILAVPGLTAILEGEFDGLQDFDNTGTIRIFETFGYKAGDLKFGLNAGEYISQVSIGGVNSDFGVELNPWAEYAFGKFTPRLDIVYFLGGKPALSTWHRVYGYTAASGSNYYDDNYSVISFRPSFKFTLDSVVIEAGDIVHLNILPGSDVFSVSNVVYIDFKWSF